MEVLKLCLTAGFVDNQWPLLPVMIFYLNFTSKSCPVLEDDVEGSSPPVVADAVELGSNLRGHSLGGARKVNADITITVHCTVMTVIY